MVGGIKAQCGDIFLECGEFHVRLAKLVKIFKMSVVPWAEVPPAADFKGCNRGFGSSNVGEEMCVFI